MAAQYSAKGAGVNKATIEDFKAFCKTSSPSTSRWSNQLQFHTYMQWLSGVDTTKVHEGVKYAEMFCDSKTNAVKPGIYHINIIFTNGIFYMTVEVLNKDECRTYKLNKAGNQIICDQSQSPSQLAKEIDDTIKSWNDNDVENNAGNMFLHVVGNTFDEKDNVVRPEMKHTWLHVRMIDV